MFEKLVLDFSAPVDLLTGKFDIFHSIGYFLPDSLSGKRVLTVHDLYFEKFPDFVDPNLRKYLKKYVPLFLKRCHAVIAVSEATKQDILSFYDIDPQMIHVVYLGCEPWKNLPSKEEAKQWISQTYFKARDYSYILYIGQLSPHKNISRLLESFSIFKNKMKFPYKLILGGVEVYGSSQVLKKIQEMSLNDDVVITGYINSEDLSKFYRGADIFAFPSLVEGFGIPLLEAMSSEVPILTSNVSAMPEVTGDAALLVNPESTEEMAEGLFHLATDESLRENLIKKGYERVKKFTWEKMASEILNIYKQICQ
jgi:glycosyltransferase involved in cell wall biosynthesis